MSRRIRSWPRAALVGVMLLYAMLALFGVGWGLPDRSGDAHLFGEQSPWDGATVASLAPRGARTDAEVGADVDVNPVTPGNNPIPLAATPEARAEIVRRYRLFTRQPDEMITMMALSGMNPRAGRLDPRLYQYGGLFIYPVGGLIGVCGATGLFPVTSDMVHYLEHPADFGNFYMVARLYAAAWGLLGVLLVYGISRRLAGSGAGVLAALIFVLLPVVTCMAHEAKPHLPGAVLMLTAVWFAMRVGENPVRREWAGLFVCCGAAVGMVLSSAPIVVLIPLAAARRAWAPPAAGTESNRSPANRLAAFLLISVVGGAIAVLTYLVTNPYIPINLFANRAVLRSNFGNSFAMYEVARVGEGLVRVVQLTVAGSTWPVLVLGAIGTIAAIVRRSWAMLPLATPAAVFALQFVLIGAGKPDEYGRFGVFYECALSVASAAMIAAAYRHKPWQGTLLGLLTCGWCLWGSAGYLWSFRADATHRGSRDLAARALAEETAGPIALTAEPAPYACPPLNLVDRPLILYSRGPNSSAMDGIRLWNETLSDRAGSNDAPSTLVTAIDDPAIAIDGIADPHWQKQMVFEARPAWLPPARISWANKPILVLIAGQQ